MAPELLTRQEAEELKELAARIRAFQEARQHSDNEMLRKFADLGSTKTYKRILDGDLAELDLERQLTNYRRVWALIEAIQERTAGGDVTFLDLSAPRRLIRAVLEIWEEKSNARVILVEGDTGLGKTKALAALMEKLGSNVLPVQCWGCWDDSSMALLGALLDALGEKNYAAAIVPRLKKVKELLNARRITVVFDEGHHLGPGQLNTIKGLVNDTPGQFVILAMPTLWGKIERDAWQEVRQLTGNRLAERIRLDLDGADVKKLLERMARVTDAAAVAYVMQEARSRGATNRGNLKFVAKVCRKLAEEFPDSVPALDDVVAAVRAEIARR